MSSEPNEHSLEIYWGKQINYCKIARVCSFEALLPDGRFITVAKLLRDESFGSVGCMCIVLSLLLLLLAAAEATRSTRLHLINVKGASDVWGLETIHSYCGRGTAEGQIDICSGGFKVSDLRHSNDTMARLVQTKTKKEPRKHHTPPLKVTHPIKRYRTKSFTVVTKTERNPSRVPPLWARDVGPSGAELCRDRTQISCREWLISILSLLTAGSDGPLEASASLPMSLISSEKDASNGTWREGGEGLTKWRMGSVN